MTLSCVSATQQRCRPGGLHRQLSAVRTQGTCRSLSAVQIRWLPPPNAGRSGTLDTHDVCRLQHRLCVRDALCHPFVARNFPFGTLLRHGSTHEDSSERGMTAGASTLRSEEPATQGGDDGDDQEGAPLALPSLLCVRPILVLAPPACCSLCGLDCRRERRRRRSQWRCRLCHDRAVQETQAEYQPFATATRRGGAAPKSTTAAQTVAILGCKAHRCTCLT